MKHFIICLITIATSVWLWFRTLPVSSCFYGSSTSRWEGIFLVRQLRHYLKQLKWSRSCFVLQGASLCHRDEENPATVSFWVQLQIKETDRRAPSSSCAEWHQSPLCPSPCGLVNISNTATIPMYQHGTSNRLALPAVSLDMTLAMTATWDLSSSGLLHLPLLSGLELVSQKMLLGVRSSLRSVSHAEET